MSVYTAQQHFNDAEDYKKKGLLQEAIASYKKAIEVDASFVSAYYNLALAYHQTQQPDQAIVNLKKVTELDPGDASAFNNLGVLYVAMNRLNDAKGCFEKALSIEGNYQDARDNLEKVLQKLQKSRQHTDVQETIQMHHRNIGFVTLWYERGQAYITKSLRDALDSEYNTFVFARNGGTPGNPLLQTTGEWDVPNLTVYPEFRIPREALKDWIVKNYLTAVFFNEETDLGLVEVARQCGAKTIGYYVWELFDPQYVPGCMLLYDKIICPTKACYEKFKNLGLNNIEYVQWGVDLKVFKPKEHPENQRVIFFHPAGWGGLHARRGTQFVIDAFQKLNAPNTELLIHTQHGFGVQEDKNIKILSGTVPREEIVRMYQAADVAVLPSKWEGLGLTFLESIGCGLPIITVDAPPMSEFVCDGETGFLCRVAERKRYQGIFVDGVDVDIDDMAEKMKMMLDICRRSTMQENVKAFAPDFSSTKFNEKIKNLFFDVVKQVGENSRGYKKILIVGVLDVASSTNLFMKKGFEKLGLLVDGYSYRTRLQELGSPQAMWDDFHRFLDGKRYELIVFCKVNGLHPELITYAGQHGKTWYWFMDHLGVAREIHADEYVKRADFASATSEEVCNWFRELNLKTFHLIEGFDPDTYFHEDIPKIYDVLFVGNATEKRINDLRLLRNGQTLTIFGRGWPQDFSARPPIYNEELRKAICQSKIVINLVHSNIFSDRVILTAASGGFVLSQFCPDLERFFHRKHHVDWFQTVKEAQQLIRYYLEHEAEREEIAQRGMNYVRQKYNWESVCKDILQKCDEYSTKEIAIPQEKAGERVLFVSWHGLGDNVMLIPALRKYKQKNSNCYIGVAGLERFGETLVQLLSGLSFVDEVIPCLPDAWNDFPDYKTGVAAVIQRAKAIGKEKGFSKVIVLPTNRQEGYKLHKVFRFADEVGVQFDYLEDLQTELAVTKEAEKLVEEYIKDYSKPIMVLHAKAGNQPKTLAAEDVERIINQYQVYTVFEFGRRSTSRSILVSEDNMEFSKALIKRADMVIAIDSVVMHIAGAFRRPLIAIFTITPVHQAVPLTYRVDVCGANNDMTQLDLWPSLKKEVEKKYPREKNYGFDQRWYYEGGSSCYMGYWWGERGGMGLRIIDRMNKIIATHSEMFENCKVIDVGCAAGYYVKVMRDKGIEAFGCDPSEWIVNREETLMTQYKKYLKVGFARRIPFSGNYETVLLLDILEHLSDIEYSDFLSEIKRLNVKFMIIKVPTEDRPDAFNDPTHVLIKSKDWWFKECRNLNFNFVGELDDSGFPIWFFQRTEQKDSFVYSQNYYENYYHNWTKSNSWDTFDKAIQNVVQYESRYASIFRILSSRLSNAGRALFCGVHQGKDCFWFQEIMQDWEIFGFDFSRTVLEWCKINYPKPAQLFWADAEQICLGQQTFDVYFDLVVCIDFTEHLPYQKALRFAKETFRVAKPGSLLLAQQGTCPLPEHINILKEQDFIKLFSGNGWNYFQKLPFDHYLFTKEAIG